MRVYVQRRVQMLADLGIAHPWAPERGVDDTQETA
jgi:hypothetical protein